MNKLMNVVSIALAVCGSAFAGTMGAVCDKENVSTPCANHAWDIGGQALYLKTTYSGAFSSLPDARLSTTDFQQNYVSPNWGWGFLVDAAYHFNTGNSLQLSWYHYDQLTLSNYKFLSNAVNDVYTVNPNWNAVNLELGQDVLISETSNLRLQGGVQYVHIRSAYNDSGFTTSGKPGAEYLNMGYTGVGPRMSAHFGYNLMNDLALYANGASVIDVGNGSFSHGTTYGTLPRYITGTKLLVVPEVELKLGAAYNLAIMQGKLSVDVGYMFVNYFNALINNNGVGSETDFGLNGPYVGAKWRANV